MNCSPSARVFSSTPCNFARLAAVLRAGGLVAAPTETVYGLAANALDPEACARIYRAKGRPPTDPLIVHIRLFSELGRLAFVNEAALVLTKAFWPGPLTMVLRRKAIVPLIVSAGLPSVAVRMPAHPMFRRLLRLTRVPLAAPSANPFGYVSPTTAEHVRASLGNKIDHILDGGPCVVGLESTIVDLRDSKHPRLLRPGAVTHAQLEQALGLPVAMPKRRAVAATSPQVAPGMLTRHYSPLTPVVLHEGSAMARLAAANSSEAWLFIARPRTTLRGRNIFWLDSRGDLRGVAQRLFAMLRSLDAGGFTKLHIECAAGSAGLAQAINDRLHRAAVRE